MDIENSNKIYKALIVDDESIVCQTLDFALSREGFQCDIVKDGHSAQKISGINNYDLIVTDLRMPEQNGHALTVSLLKEEAPPVIIVHTSVEDTNIIKDLIIRGVDDVIHKPTNYEIFSSKARKLVEQRHRNQSSTPKSAQPASPVKAKKTQVVTPEEVNEKLKSLDSLLSNSETPFAIYTLCSQESMNVEQLAQLIIEDASMVAQVLEAASRAYSSPLERVTKVILQKSIVKLGRKKIGEIALWQCVQQVFKEFDIPWIDNELLWKKGTAAAITTEVLSESIETENETNHEYLCALFHPLGRLVLAKLYPNKHREITERCKQTGESLDQAEMESFGVSSGQVTAKCLTKWQIPFKTVMPLEYVNKQESELLEFPTSLRSRIQKMKLANLLSQIAFSLWEPYDQIEIPSSELLKNLKNSSVSKILSVTRKKCIEQIPMFHPDENKENPLHKIEGEYEICYFSNIHKDDDILYHFLHSSGIPIEEEIAGTGLPLLINNLVLDRTTSSLLLREREKRDCYGVVASYRNSSLYPQGMSISNPFTVQQITQFIKSAHRHLIDF